MNEIETSETLELIELGEVSVETRGTGNLSYEQSAGGCQSASPPNANRSLPC